MAWKGRISRELMQLKDMSIEQHGAMYFPTSDNTIGYGLIKGDHDTPYANGFYLIKFIIPEEYPFKPPRCYHVSISGLRQSPNFHDFGSDSPSPSNGTVCISRLNTWEGSEPGKDKWIPALSISSVLDMIRMQVLTRNALDNEPDYRHSINNPMNARNYEKFVEYHNFRSNVVNIYRCLNKLDIETDIQNSIANAIFNYVKQHYDWYIERLTDHPDNGVYVNCSTYGNSKCFCNYQELLEDFKKIFNENRPLAIRNA